MTVICNELLQAKLCSEMHIVVREVELLQLFALRVTVCSLRASFWCSADETSASMMSCRVSDSQFIDMNAGKRLSGGLGA